MSTVRDLITDALMELAVIDPTEALDADKAAYGLRVLNRMIQKWNTDQLMVYTLNRQNPVNFVASQQAYTVGTGGNINIPRPAKINMISRLLSTGVETALHLYTDEEWRDVAVKSTAAAYPTGVWIANNVPLNTLYFWPIPTDATASIVLYTWGLTTDFANINATVTFPPGYEEAIVTNLAIALSNAFGTQPSPSLVMRARDAKKQIESLNVDPIYLSTDFPSRNSGNRAIRSFGLVVDPS